jgi:lysophospholipase L1-like esterase
VNLARYVGPVVRRFVAPHKVMRCLQFEALPIVPDRVVFLGDSITDGGLWDEWFPDFATQNRGIAGDTVGGVLERLDSALHEPRAVSLLIGTNDLSGLGRSHRVDDIAEQMDELVSRIATMAPDASLYVNGVMPRSKSLADDIQLLNVRYERLAAKHDAEYLDLWPAFVGPDRALRKDLTGDGTHLNGAGYQVWVDILRPYLAPTVGEHVTP